MILLAIIAALYCSLCFISVAKEVFIKLIKIGAPAIGALVIIYLLLGYT